MYVSNDNEFFFFDVAVQNKKKETFVKSSYHLIPFTKFISRFFSSESIAQYCVTSKLFWLCSIKSSHFLNFKFIFLFFSSCQNVKCKKMKLILTHYVKCAKFRQGGDCQLCEQLLKVIGENALSLFSSIQKKWRRSTPML